MINLKYVNKKLNKKYAGRVKATYKDGTAVLSGSLSQWQDIVDACACAVDKKKRYHVVNDIALEACAMPKMKLPQQTDDVLKGMTLDVLIIGGGISGASIARELSKWNLKILLIDKEPDFALGASGRNDGEIHPGIDLNKGSLKQHYVISGNKIYEKLCSELNVPFRRCGQYVGFTKGWIAPILKLFAWQRRCVCKVEGARVISGKRLRMIEPELNPAFKCALYTPGAGVVSPYGLTIALIENAVHNGVKVSLNTAVLSMDVHAGTIGGVRTNRGMIHPKVVINAAGVFAEDIAKMAGDRFYSIHPRRGTNSILDKKSAHIVKSVASVKMHRAHTPHTKGGGILHTIDDNILVGPDAIETYLKEDVSTNRDSIDKVFDKQAHTVPQLSQKDIITYFTGVRAPTFEEDFILEKGRKTKNLIHCAGIQSPGLTAAPAFAPDIARMAVELLCETDAPQINADFDPHRKSVPVLRDMSQNQRDRLIKQNPDYGVIVCRCEEISKGEILDALKNPCCPPTVDAVKKRLRPGMGRCQGGFCMPLVCEIIADYLGVPLTEVKKAGANATICCYETKGATR